MRVQRGAKGCTVGAHQCLGSRAAGSSRHPITSWRSSPYFAGRSTLSHALSVTLSRLYILSHSHSRSLCSFSLSLGLSVQCNFPLFLSLPFIPDFPSYAVRFSTVHRSRSPGLTCLPLSLVFPLLFQNPLVAHPNPHLPTPLSLRLLPKFSALHGPRPPKLSPAVTGNRLDRIDGSMGGLEISRNLSQLTPHCKVATLKDHSRDRSFSVFAVLVYS